jgi:hypothetical protein
MALELYVVAASNDFKRLQLYQDYFNSVAMRVIGVNPAFNAVSTPAELYDKLKENSKPGLLIIDYIEPKKGQKPAIKWHDAAKVNAARDINSLEIIVFGDNKTIKDASKLSFTAKKRECYNWYLNKLLVSYARPNKMSLEEAAT